MPFVFYDGADEHEPDPAAASDAPGPWLWLGGQATDGDLPLLQPAAGSGAGTQRPAGPTRPATAAVLEIVDGPAAGESFGLLAGRTVVGRGGRADVRIDSSDVSREHCLLEVTEAGEVTLTDLGSRNGTEVNGFQVADPVPVGPADVIALGGTVLIQVRSVTALPPRAGAGSAREVRPGDGPPTTKAVTQEPAGLAPGATPRASKPIFSISALLSPLTMAAVTVVITHQVRYAAIAGLSPLMAIVNFAGGRTRDRDSVRSSVPAFRDEPEQVPIEADPPAMEIEPELEHPVSAAREATHLDRLRPAPLPAPDPLPGNIPLAAVTDRTGRGFQTQTTGLPALAVADDSYRQSQYLAGWDPAAGNLLLYGMSGYGTTSALATLAIAIARARPPDAVHLYVLDLGTGKLAPLVGLPHVGAYIGPAERERQGGLVRLLCQELDARNASGGRDRPADVLVLIDSIGSLLAGFGKDAAAERVPEDLERVYVEGPTVGIRFAATADRGDAVPRLWAALTEQKLLFQLGGPDGYESFDIPHPAIPSSLVPGRAVIAATGQLIQFAWPGADLTEQVARAGGCWAGASRVQAMG
ncbi:MAG: FHA domain-containing protein [Streptosporangiaceae bacterium]|nr:FHA domain-containing protein [Streptosporangiaceae bacterium]